MHLSHTPINSPHSLPLLLSFAPQPPIITHCPYNSPPSHFNSYAGHLPRVLLPSLLSSLSTLAPTSTFAPNSCQTCNIQLMHIDHRKYKPQYVTSANKGCWQAGNVPPHNTYNFSWHLQELCEVPAKSLPLLGKGIVERKNCILWFFFLSHCVLLYDGGLRVFVSLAHGKIRQVTHSLALIHILIPIFLLSSFLFLYSLILLLLVLPSSYCKKEYLCVTFNPLTVLHSLIPMFIRILKA